MLHIIFTTIKKKLKQNKELYSTLYRMAMTTLHIENNVSENDVDAICDFFEKYELGKVNDIEYDQENKSAIVHLDYWCDNVCATNMYNRIQEHGETRIVYNDPEYFTVKFYTEAEPNMANVQDTMENNTVVEGGERDTADYRDDYVARENNLYEYLEDDVIDNSHNIELLFRLIEDIKSHINISDKSVKSVERRLGNIQKKTAYLYKHKPVVVKRSVWKSRLRPRARQN